MITVRSATGCSSGLLETYGFDEAGNRTSALGRTYTYADDGQLATCSGSPACSPTFDADGRLTKITTVADGTWSYLYDGESRLVSACKSTSCTGSGFARLDMTYDGEGHRTRLVETPASGSPTTTDFRYQGDAITSEVSVTGATTITRTFTTDESGAIVKVAISGDPVSLHNGTYLVTWNGHGDAVALSKIDTTTGALMAANRYTYSTWGMPSTTTHNGFGDLRFRYLYVGQYDVQWDHSTAVPAGLLYMHARHYSPEFGRFLQPDPSALEANFYAYAGNSPVVNIDPDGEYWKARRGGGGGRASGAGGRGGVRAGGGKSGGARGVSVSVPSGLKGASKALKGLFSGGGIEGKSIISIRQALLRAGWKQTVSRNGRGYLFKNPANGETVRIMARNGKWEVRIQNGAGNQLDRFGRVGTPSTTHGIHVESK